MISRAIPIDVTDEQAVRTLVEQAVAEGMDIAVNNAGTTHRPTPLGDLAIEDADRVLRVTLRGTLVAMQHELAALTRLARSSRLTAAKAHAVLESGAPQVHYSRSMKETIVVNELLDQTRHDAAAARHDGVR